MTTGFVCLSAAMTDVGKQRSLNEDSVLDRPDIGLWAVADGMGGHGGGDVASQAIVAQLQAIPEPASASAFLDAFEAGVLKADQDLRVLASEAGKATIGSTLAALLIYERHFACVWCGDSRVYQWRAGRLTQISHDHSEVQELIDRRVLDKSEARNWPRANIVTRAVGAGAKLELEIVDRAAEVGDRYLICSDGLCAHLVDEELAVALHGVDPQSICRFLIDTTLLRGARDNVSAIVVFCEAPIS